MSFQSTTGLGVAAKLVADVKTLTLSLSGTNTHQLTVNVEDVAGNVQTVVALVLSAAANASGGTTVYTGTITGGGSNAFAGYTFVVAGFDTAANNGTFECTASTTTTLTLTNAAGVSDTHAATATSEEASYPIKFVSFEPSVATVSAAGLITGVAKGGAVISAYFPTFTNAVGNVTSSNNIMNGVPINSIHATVNVQVNT